MKARLLGAMCAILAISCFPSTASAYSLTGDQVDGVLTDGFQHTLLSQFSPTTNVTVTDPGSEFTGGLRADGWSGNEYDVIVNLSDNFFTVEIQRTVVGSAATAIGVGGTATLFDISLTGLDGGEAISAVSYNDALTVGFTGGLAPTKTINFTPTSIELGFGGVRWGNIYHFDINPAPVPIPPAVWLFGSGLLGLVGIARRKKAA